MTCTTPDCDNYTEGNTLHCATHNAARRKSERLSKLPPKKRKAIPKFSKKRKLENVSYNERVKIWIEDKQCAVFGGYASQVHHQKGRYGFADKWAKENGISLYLDERFWLAVSDEGHRYIEMHPEESKQRGWSLSRLENLDQEPEII